jgi:hypothetical protein
MQLCGGLGLLDYSGSEHNWLMLFDVVSPSGHLTGAPQPDPPHRRASRDDISRGPATGGRLWRHGALHRLECDTYNC